MGKNERERGGGLNTIKRDQRVKGTDLLMGEERRVDPSYTIHSFNLHYMTQKWRLIKHDNASVHC